MTETTRIENRQALEASKAVRVDDALAELERRWPISPGQRETLLQLADVYAAKGVLPDGVHGEAAPLKDCCPDRGACWRSNPDPATDPAARGVSLPFVGDDYATGRIALVGLNVNNAGGSLVLWKVAAASSVDRETGANKRNTQFDRRIGEIARRVVERPGEPALTAEGVHLRTAFLEAVKCGLARPRGTPTPPMMRNCPSRFLSGEMDVLQPRGVLVFGWDAAEPIRQALGVTGWTWMKKKRLEHGTFEHAGGSSWLINLCHPSALRRDWKCSVDLFNALLASRPSFRLAEEEEK